MLGLFTRMIHAVRAIPSSLVHKFCISKLSAGLSERPNSPVLTHFKLKWLFVLYTEVYFRDADFMPLLC